MPDCLPFGEAGELRPAVSSAPYNPVVAGGRRNTLRVRGPARPPLATATRAASSSPAGCCETHPVGVVTVRLAQESLLCSCGSPSAAHRRLNEPNRAGEETSRTLTEN